MSGPAALPPRGVGATLRVEGISRVYGSVMALDDVSMSVEAGHVTCLLGDNGAGKSTLIRILSGVVPPSRGTLTVDGVPVRYRSPRDAQAQGIATVHQDLALIPLLSVWRNFFLAAEPTRGAGPFRRIDVEACRRIAREGLRAMGLNLEDMDQPVGTLSGGERQCVAIARAVHFGARVLILDEPTAALGVRQAAVVLRYVAAARDRGVAVVLVTHNPHQAHAVGDRFVMLRRGRCVGDFARADISVDELARLMSGADELAVAAARGGGGAGEEGA
jgi:simple sugar transport system ATP-binding protein